jgi:hypothetical protein
MDPTVRTSLARTDPSSESVGLYGSQKNEDSTPEPFFAMCLYTKQQGRAGGGGGVTSSKSD